MRWPKRRRQPRRGAAGRFLGGGDLGGCSFLVLLSSGCFEVFFKHGFYVVFLFQAT